MIEHKQIIILGTRSLVTPAFEGLASELEKVAPDEYQINPAILREVFYTLVESMPTAAIVLLGNVRYHDSTTGNGTTIEITEDSDPYREIKALAERNRVPFVFVAGSDESAFDPARVASAIRS